MSTVYAFSSFRALLTFNCIIAIIIKEAHYINHYTYAEEKMSEILKSITDSQILRMSEMLREAECTIAVQDAEIARMGRQILSLERQVNEAVKQAIYDPLTGLVTRKEMEREILLHFASLERAEMMIEKGRAQTAEVEHFSILFFDLNDLKTINDTFGHNAGDVLLETFGLALRSHFMRGTDVLCRWGGDEFVVLLGSVIPCEKARKIAEEFLSALTDVTLCFSIEGASGGETHNMPISVAVGASSTAEGIRTLDGIISAADTEMYQHKKKLKTD